MTPEQLRAKDEEAAEKLWQLLDDISTLGDSMKPEQNAYFKRVSQIVSRRHEILTSDGYKLYPHARSNESLKEANDRWEKTEREYYLKNDALESELSALKARVRLTTKQSNYIDMVRCDRAFESREVVQKLVAIIDRIAGQA